MIKKHDDSLHDVGRALHILNELFKNKSIKKSTLARMFSVSEKTISRDIIKLKDANFNIEFNKDGYYLKSCNFFNIFDQKDIGTLTFLQKIFEKVQDNELPRKKEELQESIANILEKIQKFQNIQQDFSKFFDEVSIFSDRTAWNFSFQYLLKIIEAIQNKKLLKIHYKDEIRILEPVGTYVSTQGNWLLIAYCRTRNDWRQFRIDRIQDLLLTNTFFKERDLFSKEQYPDLTDEERKFSIPKYLSKIVIENNEFEL